ncbi:META domain-containing protein [Cryptosporangium minutisporangium]|uniref:DUF306 domain-containing protein n=1 Tax=Cryptosporangium minutisporangium TaxID=113569 RepID=A0ABP6STF1_9ACTN
MTRLALLFVLLLVAACGPAEGSESPATDRPDDPLAGKVFRSVAVTEDGADRPLATDVPITLRFGTDRTINVQAACNQISGPVTIDGDRLRVGDLMTTEMGCDPPRMAEDEWLSAFFRATPTWRLAARDLVLATDRTEIRFAPFESTSPPVIGTRWVVTGLVSGESVGSVPAGVEAFLTFDENRVTGSTGCNRLSGSVALESAEVRFGPVVTTKMACGGGADATERAVLAVLNAGTVRMSLESGTLRLTAGEKGLMLEGR